MMAFEGGNTNSFREESELFVMKSFRPHNSIKVFEYDFVINEITEVYDIPISQEKLKGIQDVQITRVSGDTATYAVFLDSGDIKEVYILQFDQTKARPSPVEGHIVFTVEGSLLGKIDILSPMLSDTYQKGGHSSKVLIN